MKMREKLSDEQLAKLPKWAREEYTVLYMRYAEAKKDLEVHAAADDSLIVVNPYSDHPQSLPARTTIAFRIGGRRILAQIRAFSDDMWLDICGDCGIRIEPRASNNVYIRGDGR